MEVQPRLLGICNFQSRYGQVDCTSSNVGLGVHREGFEWFRRGTRLYLLLPVRAGTPATTWSSFLARSAIGWLAAVLVCRQWRRTKGHRVLVIGWEPPLDTVEIQVKISGRDLFPYPDYSTEFHNPLWKRLNMDSFQYPVRLIQLPAPHLLDPTQW